MEQIFDERIEDQSNNEIDLYISPEGWYLNEVFKGVDSSELHKDYVTRSVPLLFRERYKAKFI